jgi:hypothetical protein
VGEAPKRGWFALGTGLLRGGLAGSPVRPGDKAPTHRLATTRGSSPSPATRFPDCLPCPAALPAPFHAPCKKVPAFCKRFLAGIARSDQSYTRD